MKQFLRNLKIVSILLVLLVAFLLVGLLVQQKRSQRELSVAVGENKQALKQRYMRAGSIYSADGVLLAHSKNGEREYAADPALARACLHLVGDYTHRLPYGIESVYMPELLGTSRSFFTQLFLDFKKRGFTGDDLILTVDSKLMLKADSLLSDYSGSIVMFNYRSGDILALVSSPRLYPQDVIDWTNIIETSLFNRALYGRYLPGSTFKIIPTAALLSDSKLDVTMTVDCKGKEPIVPAGAKETLTPKGHGRVGLAQAFPKSCNAFFGQLAVELGRERLLEQAENFGFNQELFIDRLKIATSTIDLTEPGIGALSWAGVGQPIGRDRLTLSPVHLAMLSGAIANEGVLMKPHLLRQEIDPTGVAGRERESEQYSICCDQHIAKAIEKLMLDTVSSGTGKRAYRDGLKIAGKTGTAEMIDSDGKSVVNSLFTGYLISETHPIAIAVVLEDENRAAAQLAGDLLSYAAKRDLP
ncbi:MAG: penicillin-binding transpeptidase domain-containing protein [Saccharofermentanales bacterium]|jgi:peptidoglycan glycosyltransferase